jgi:hypothetical protein
MSIHEDKQLGSGSIDDIVSIKVEAGKKGFTAKELDIINTVYDLAMVDSARRNPYSVYRENKGYDQQYFAKIRSDAAAAARHYISSKIDEWQKAGDKK